MNGKCEIRKKYLAFGVPDYTDAEIEAVARIMRSGWVGMGPETLLFEKELARYIGAKEVVTVNSCTSALFLALLVSGVVAADEVIVPSLTWCASANAALYLGARPVFCDVDPDHMCVTPETVLARVSKKTKAVVVVHYGGYPCDVSSLRAALPPNIGIIEDAAHAFGAHHASGKRVGSSGNLVCFSFYANKNLSTAEGGAIALMDSKLSDRLRRLRMSGMNSNAWSRYIKPCSALEDGIDELGYKMNYTDLQAAIGRIQLGRFAEMQKVRFEIVKNYRKTFESYGLPFLFQKDVCGDNHARHLLVGLVEDAGHGLTRDELLLALHARNVGVSIHYTPLHQMPLYQQFSDFELPVTDQLGRQILTLPISATFDNDDVNYVVRHFCELMGSVNRRPIENEY